MAPIEREVDHHPRPTAAECVAAYLALRERAPQSAPWRHSARLEFGGFEPVRDEPHWRESAALGLFALLAPERPLPRTPHQLPSREHPPMYQHGADSLWLAGDGAAVLRATVCFSNAGGVDEVWHVFPAADRRVLFSIGTDYTQSSLVAVLGADTPEGLAALRALVGAYFTALGLTG